MKNKYLRFKDYGALMNKNELINTLQELEKERNELFDLCDLAVRVHSHSTYCMCSECNKLFRKWTKYKNEEVEKINKSGGRVRPKKKTS